ncbi:MAG: hypothetical protein HPY44_01675 [Armatimonadetes bacterium]|nr:hypothetical protein [Armatimonadota bacterium]
MTDWDDRVTPGDEADSEDTPEEPTEIAPDEADEYSTDEPESVDSSGLWEPAGYRWSTAADAPVEALEEAETVDTTGLSGGLRALLVALGCLFVMVLAVGGFALKLWFDRLAAQEALGASARALSLTMSPALAGALNPRLEAVNEAIERGHFAEAATRLDNILRGVGGQQGAEGTGEGSPFPGPNFAMPPSGSKSEGPGADAPGNRQGTPGRAGRPGGPGGAPPGAQGGLEELPPAAVAFFQKNPDIGKLVAQANMMGLQLKERGGDVTKLRDLRRSIIEAARLQDADEVLDLLKQFDAEFKKQAAKIMGSRPGTRPEGGRMPRPGRRPQGPTQPPKRFLTMARQCGEALQKAQMEGRDVRPALQFMRQGELAARAGNFKKAMEVTRKAMDALKNAPAMPAQPKLFQNPIVHMLLGLMKVEDDELRGALTSLRNTYAIAKNTTVTELSKAMGGAIETLERVGKRRQSVGRQLEMIRSGKKPDQSAEEMARQAEEMREKARERLEATREEMGKILERAREMSPEEFAKEKDGLLDAILKLIFPPRPGEPGAQAGKPSEPERPVDLPTEDRVRQKLLLAAEPYLKVKADPEQKELATELADLFRRSRELLAKRDYDQAEMLAERGLALLGIGQDSAGSAPNHAPESPQDPAGPSD